MRIFRTIQQRPEEAALVIGLLVMATVAVTPPRVESGEHCLTTNVYDFAEMSQSRHLQRGAFMATITHVADPTVVEWRVCGHYS